MEGISSEQLDIDFFKLVIPILNETFPNKLNILYITNTTKIMKTGIKIIKNFMDKETRKKVRVISKHESQLTHNIGIPLECINTS